MIVGLAGFGKANYETEYNSGIASNGLTMQATSPGRPGALMTFAGYSIADIESGRLLIAFGPGEPSATCISISYAA